MRTEKGFTLLEVMIALAVFATLAAAVMSASQYVLRQSARVEARLLAGWLADNHLSELHLQSATLAIGSKTLTQRFAQREWRLVQRIVSEPDTGLLRVELSVSPAGSDPALLSVTHWLARSHD
ncbi:type II secretion system minor pseudopilin GspI [Pseudomonas sp. CCC3.1]|uniref:type II secretion system minor pseudopilin GspI n=1 Tax=Pseudomonas sp. CCC3.1 TaxID=3048607 RepID=UPI002AC9148B|nr:type II secretion system minor pseudopilin GspI [Pseudomonas sp. CCC3.1]MEB0208517.1 type II secretion system minor pseudopilin GspI [Pseudomonas sp. CCC3.1]WPX35768.1 type II secretion system minor pseudopilin GspI [Pseudomonas sp. CCC3.1]